MSSFVLLTMSFLTFLSYRDGIRIEVCHWAVRVREQWDEGLHLDVKP